MKLLLRALLIVAGFAASAVFCKKQTDGFTIASIHSTLPFRPEWNVEQACLPPSIFDQTFTYLSKGAQSYVFASKDGKYVLKFFRHDHMRPRPWSFLGERPGDARRKAKLEETFSSCIIAATRFREESGLVFVHLNKTDHLQQKITIVDKIGIVHELQADEMEFLVQKKAALLYPTLEEYMAMGKVKESQELLASLTHLLQGRIAKRIFDKDPNVETNFGVVDGQVVQIDTGRFSLAERQEASFELIRATDALQKHLERTYPTLATYLKEKVRET